MSQMRYKNAFNYVNSHPGCSVKEIAEAVHLSRDALQIALLALTEVMVIQRQMEKAVGCRARYYPVGFDMPAPEHTKEQKVARIMITESVGLATARRLLDERGD